MSENKLKYEYVPANVNVISYGDVGEKFYITLHGTLSVFLPTAEYKKKFDIQKVPSDHDINKNIVKFIKK